MFKLFLGLCFRRQDRYHLVARLHEHRGAINTLAFTPNGRILASGSDDETVKLWSTEKAICLQTLVNEGQGWGQITAMAFIGSDGEWLIFSTGRGLVCIYGRAPGRLYREMAAVPGTSASSDPVELLVFDRATQRLAVTSHFGEIRAYRIELQNFKATFRQEWSRNNAAMIPRSSAFVNLGRDLLIFGLNTGDVTTLSSGKGEMVSRHQLDCPIGSAVINSTATLFLLHNIGTGFALYNLTTASLVQTIPVNSAMPIVTDIKFGENGAIATAGGAASKAYVIHLESGRIVQRLNHGRGPVQALDMACMGDCHLIVCGSSDDFPDITLWAKPTKLSMHRRWASSVFENPLLWLCIFVLFVLAYQMRGAWALFLNKETTFVVRKVDISDQAAHKDVQGSSVPGILYDDDLFQEGDEPFHFKKWILKGRALESQWKARSVGVVEEGEDGIPPNIIEWARKVGGRKAQVKKVGNDGVAEVQE
ncbi:WD40-repeat-containing domain protein [Desarmillaria tabescens]|uniref:WD40-repeat-containing domain protein n=1 Tax=Armillaria tabescens TaxID=1929756 RepID=A0AA39J534_ARMTA|nr:WD40-repeat-containing domain protein [Desarmillaria tabescens]KAK0436312.1 WD40-repeat-containing domain protein [Desarmillaria tabescens]